MAKTLIAGSIEDMKDADEFQQEIAAWYEASEQLAKLKAKEAELRAKIFRVAFPKPVEGTQKFELRDSWRIDCKVPYTYKPLADAFPDCIDALEKAGIDYSSLVKWKPEISVSEYKKLNDDQKSVVNAFIEIKAGSPQMKIEKPKR